jgi:hypothetical protein
MLGPKGAEGCGLHINDKELTMIRFVSLMALGFAAACATNGDGKHTSGGGKGDTDSPVAELGESCGGFVVNPAVCDTGLECQAGTNPDLPGTCVPKVGQLGDSCGGFVRNPVQCADGLECQANSIPDVPGTCVNAKAGLGESCGGNVINPKECEDGLTCQANPTSPDLPGTCVQN